MLQQLIGLVVGAGAVVAGDRHVETVRQKRALQRLDPRQNGAGDHDGVGALALGDGEADGGGLAPTLANAGIAPGTGLVLAGRLDDIGDIADIDHFTLRRGKGEHADIRWTGQGAAGRHRHGLTVFAHHARGEGAVGLSDGVHQTAQGNPVQGQLGRIGLDTDLVRPSADDEGQANVVDLGDLGAQLAGDLIEGLVGPLARGAGLGRKREHEAWNVVDAARLDQRLGDARGNPVEICADLLVDANRGCIRISADLEAGGDHDLVVVSEGVDMLDAGHALDDGLQRLADQLHRVGRAKARRGDHDVHHGHTDLRLFFAGYGGQRQKANGNRRQQEQRRQR